MLLPNLIALLTGTAAEATMVFSSAWFVGLLVALILVAAFFALVCLIQQNQGGRYTGQFAGKSKDKLLKQDFSHLFICDFMMSSITRENN